MPPQTLIYWCRLRKPLDFGAIVAPNWLNMAEIMKTEHRTKQNLRLEPDIWAAIDAARKQRPGTVSRNTWIAEAVLEKLQRDHETAPQLRPREGVS